MKINKKNIIILICILNFSAGIAQSLDNMDSLILLSEGIKEMRKYKKIIVDDSVVHDNQLEKVLYFSEFGQLVKDSSVSGYKTYEYFDSTNIKSIEVHKNLTGDTIYFVIYNIYEQMLLKYRKFDYFLELPNVCHKFKYEDSILVTELAFQESQLIYEYDFEYKFDDNNNIVKILRKQNALRIDSTVFEFDENQRIIKKHEYTEHGFYFINYTYSENVLKTSCSNFDGIVYCSTYKYDTLDNKKIKSTELITRVGELDTSIVIKVKTAEGQILEETKDLITAFYLYDDKDKLIQIKKEDHKKILLSETLISYLPLGVLNSIEITEYNYPAHLRKRIIYTYYYEFY